MNANGTITVADLKDYLQEIIDNLSWDYEDEDEVRISPNTYGMHAPFLSTQLGFIDLDNPVYER